MPDGVPTVQEKGISTAESYQDPQEDTTQTPGGLWASGASKRKAEYELEKQTEI